MKRLVPVVGPEGFKVGQDSSKLEICVQGVILDVKSLNSMSRMYLNFLLVQKLSNITEFAWGRELGWYD